MSNYEERAAEITEGYGNYIHLSRYSRWIEEENRRETWPETVRRYITFFKDRFSEHGDVCAQLDIAEQYILKKEVMPSMRCLMTAGKALERDNIAGFNPVVGNTKVVVRNIGNIPIKYLHEGETYEVLNVNKEWTEATFKSYGIQDTYKVVTKLNSNTVKEVECTANHRWVLLDGTVKATSELSKGDRLPFASAKKPEIDDDYYLGIQHGIVYGDGTASKAAKRIKGYVVRLCGQSRELLSYFKNYPITYPPSTNGDPLVQMYDAFAATHALKELPSNGETDSYLLGFIRGWMAADGSVGKTSYVTLCVNDIGKKWLETFSERLGFVIQHIRKQSSETNYGKRTRDSYIISFSRSSITEDDLLCSWKRENFKSLQSHYVVSEVIPTGNKEEVFCAEVPETNTFTLAGGLVTGNCSAIAIDNVRAFDEVLYTLMCGTGVGFSVERQYVSKLPEVAEAMYQTDTTIIVEDSKIGWAKSYRELIQLLYAGQMPRCDVSKVRPAGSRLKTFGGRASGPKPLVDLFKFTADVFSKAVGRKLSSIECHDIVCKIAEVVVVGGVRRSALISLSNLSDDRMREAKSGMWWDANPQRALANNSAAYTEKPDLSIFMKEWVSLYNSKSGERGIVNRVAFDKQAAKYGRRAPYNNGFLTNPCGEIILRSGQVCNLTEVVVRSYDNWETLSEKAEIASFLGTLQASLTDFRYLRSVWKRNTEEEALLGVSLTGVMDNPLTYTINAKLKEMLNDLRQTVVDINKKWAATIGIAPSAATTANKPSGTVSQLVDCASGIHPRYAYHYVRRVRNDKKDPLSLLMKDMGIPCEEDKLNPNAYVFSFPMRAPEGAITTASLSAQSHLELWKVYRDYWCEHNPSVTVSYSDDEFLGVGAWVWENWENVGGISFLPRSEHVYAQAPYEAITEETWKAMVDAMPKLDWSKLKEYESEDNVTNTKELACTAGHCEL